MEIKNIEKAAKLFEQLVSVDTAIDAIEQLAKKLINTDTVTLLNLTVTDKRKQKESEDSVSIDEDGSLRRNNYYPTPQWLKDLMANPIFLSADVTRGAEYERNSYLHKLDHGLTEAETMAVLQVLLQLRYKTRNKIIAELKDLGYHE